MDIEQRFIAALLTANGNDQDRFLAQRLPLSVFPRRMAEIRWLVRFQETHHKLPSLVLFNQKFSAKLKRPADSVKATLQCVLDMAMYDQMVRLNGQAKEMLDRGDPV